MSIKRQSRLRNRLPGTFTLVEMIVAMGVLAILTALLFTVLNETSRLTSQTMGRSKVFTDVRVVMEQYARELQEAVSDPQRQCFWSGNISGTNGTHWIATIDNNTGNEDVEVHYIFDSTTYTVRKCLEFWTTNGFANQYWDCTNGNTTWYTGANGPSVSGSSEYVTVLEGVLNFTNRFSTNRSVAGAWANTWDYRSSASGRSNLPAYVETTLQIFDPQDLVRYRGAANIPTNQVRTFTIVTFLPRQQQ